MRHGSPAGRVTLLHVLRGWLDGTGSVAARPLVCGRIKSLTVGLARSIWSAPGVPFVLAGVEP